MEDKFETKTVNFLGTDYEVPEWANHICLDDNGDIYCFEERPYSNYGNYNSIIGSRSSWIAEISTWKEI